MRSSWENLRIGAEEFPGRPARRIVLPFETLEGSQSDYEHQLGTLKIP